MKRVGMALAALVLLAACGSESDAPVLNAVRAALEAKRQSGAQPDLDAQQAEIVRIVRGSGHSGPVLMVALPKGNVAASLIVDARNGDVVTWRDATGVSVVTRRGVVISTRGLGHDVMASDVSGTLAALDHGGGGYQRLQRFLDGEGHLRDQYLRAEERDSGTLPPVAGGGRRIRGDHAAPVTTRYRCGGGCAVSLLPVNLAVTTGRFRTSVRSAMHRHA